MEQILSGFPIVYTKELLLINETNSIAIACMWSLKQTIYDRISESNLSKINLIGNTYSINADKGIITNICANRNIRHIIITGNILSYQDIVDRLIEVFSSNIFESYMEKYKDYLEVIREQILTCQYIPEDDLNKYIECLYEKGPLYDLKFTTKTLEYFKIEKIPSLPPPINVKDIVMKLEAVEKYPSNISGYTVHCYDGDLYNTFLDICQLINTRGYVNGETKELNNLMVILHSIDYNTIKQFPQITELTIDEYKKSILSSTCPADISYTYGSLLYTHIPRIIDELKKSDTTRRCYVPIYSHEHAQLEQPPCAVSVFFETIEKKLNLTVTFRSNDMFNAWILNIIAFSTFLEHICEKIKKPRGIITTIGFSSHIYNNDLINLKCLLKNYTKKSIYTEPEGYFIIKKEKIEKNINSFIIVQLWSNNHELIKEWQDVVDNYEMFIEIISSYINNPQHAAYVAKEITKLSYSEILHQ